MFRILRYRSTEPASRVRPRLLQLVVGQSRASSVPRSYSCIRHATLGEVRCVQTAGLVYIVTLVCGEEVHVDSEENPGKIDYASRKDMNRIDNWDFEVDLSRVDT